MQNIQKSQIFTLRLRVAQNRVFSSLVTLACIFVVTLVLIKFSWNTKLPLAVRGLICAGLLLLTYVQAIAAAYLLRLLLTSKNRLDLSRDGMVDSASILALGAVKTAAIDKIRFVKQLGTEFLQITFTRQAATLHRGDGFHRGLYLIFIGDRLWIPLHIFEISRLDLESQIIHFNQLREKTEVSDDKIMSPRDALEPVEVETESDSTPPPVDQVIARDPIRNRVSQIKKSVKDSRFDEMIALLYLDHLSQFPMYEDRPEFIPPAITRVQSLQKGNDYEEVSFVYKGKVLQFGLRRDIGSSNEALLSVGVDNRVQMSLRVRVEIGILDPIELESFRIGDWQNLVLDLKKDIEQFEAIRLGRVPSETVEQEVTQTRTNLEELKSRFGLDEE